MPSPRPSRQKRQLTGEKASAGEDGVAGPRSVSFREGWQRFWFEAADVAALHGVRCLLGIYLLIWLGSTYGHYKALYGLNGWFDTQAYVELATLPDETRPFVGWSPIFWASNTAILSLMYFGSLLAFALFAAGFAVRMTSVLSWLGFVTFTANPALGYGGDVLLGIVAFYVMTAYVLRGTGATTTIGSLLGGPEGAISWPLGFLESSKSKSSAANFAMRLLQLHMAIAIAACGLFKLQIGEWWAGDALWFPLFHPSSTSLDDIVAWKQRTPTFLLSLIGILTYATLLWQLAFPFLIWRRRWLKVMISGAIFGMLGNWFVYKLPTYGPVLLIGCLAFVDPTSWRPFLERIRRSNSEAAEADDHNVVERISVIVSSKVEPQMPPLVSAGSA